MATKKIPLTPERICEIEQIGIENSSKIFDLWGKRVIHLHQHDNKYALWMEDGRLITIAGNEASIYFEIESIEDIQWAALCPDRISSTAFYNDRTFVKNNYENATQILKAIKIDNKITYSIEDV